MSISVIIPTYNRKGLLVKTLTSILNQSLKADEIIVVDNGSTDGTVDFLKSRYREDLIVVENKGTNSPGAARNLGFSIATGDHVKFFDSDDLMTSNTLEVQYKALSNSDKGFIYGPYFYATEQTEGSWKSLDDTIINYYPFSEKKSLTQWMCRGLFITIPGMLFRKELLEKVGPWREDVMAYEDWEYLWRLSLQEPYPAHTNKTAFIYRVHGEQTTLNNSDHLKRDREKLIVLSNIYSKHLEKSGLSVIDKGHFTNLFHQTIIAHKKGILQAPVNYSVRVHRLFWQYVRVLKKTGRVKTKTNWQPEYGPKQNVNIIDEYIDMLN